MSGQLKRWSSGKASPGSLKALCPVVWGCDRQPMKTYTPCLEIHRKGGRGEDAKQCADTRNSRMRGMRREAEVCTLCALTHWPTSYGGGLTWMLFSCRFR